MRKGMRGWLALGLVLLSCATVARAQIVGDGAKTQPIGAKMAGVAMGDTTGRVLRVTANGVLQFDDANRDRSYSTQIAVFNGVVLNAGTTYQPNTPKYIGEFSRASLMLNFGAAVADSDSVRFGIRIWGKSSLNSGNLYLWTPHVGGATTDSCNTNGQVDADSTGTGRCLQPFSYILSRRYNPYAPRIAFIVRGEMTNVYEGTFTTPSAKRVRIIHVPTDTWRPIGNNGGLIQLSDNAGNPCPYPFIFIEITNLTIGCNITGVSIDIWPRVF